MNAHSHDECPWKFCGPVDAMEVAVITDHADETFQIDLDNAALMESWTFTWRICSMVYVCFLSLFGSHGNK